MNLRLLLQADFNTMSGAKMKAIKVKNAKSDHTLGLKEAERQGTRDVDGIEFDESTVDTSAIDMTGNYLQSWYFAPSTAIEQMTRGLLSNVFALDAAHCDMGTLFTCIGKTVLV